MEENNNKRVPKLNENYMEIFKNGIMEKKSIIAEKGKEKRRLREKIQREKVSLGDIKDKESKRFKSKKGYIQKLSNNLREKSEQLEKLKEEAKNTIAVMRVALQRNIDYLTRKALTTQNEKNTLEAQVNILESDKNKYEKAIEQSATDSRIPEDKRNIFIENANKKIEELKEEISLKKSKILHMSVELPEYINQISEMNDNLQYIDYDKIEEYEVKETDKDEKGAEEKDQKDGTARKDETAKKDKEEDQKDQTTKKDEEKDQKDEGKKDESKKAEQEETPKDKLQEQLAQEKAAREEAERKLAQEQAEKQKLLQEKQAYEARKKAEEQAKRAETNTPYREGEELPNEQTQEIKPEEDSRPMLYISEKDGVVAYYMNKSGNMINTAKTKEASEEKKEKYDRLNIKGICKEIAGKRIASALLYSKINPSIIKALENEPETIYNYIKSIHNKEPLPFKLIHNVSGKSMIQRLAAMRYTRAEKASGAVIQTSNMLDEGKGNSQQQNDYSLLELLNNAQLSESQKTAIKDYAIINGEDKAKATYEHVLSDARRELNIQKFKETSRNLPGKDPTATRNSGEGVTVASLAGKGLFSEKGKNAGFVPKVENQDGRIEEAAKNSVNEKQEELERFSNQEIPESVYQANLASHRKER